MGWGVGALVLAALMQLRQHLRIVRGGGAVEQLGRAGVGELAVEAVVQLEPEVHREAPVRVGGCEQAADAIAAVKAAMAETVA